VTGLATDVIIRYLTRDDAAKASRCLALLRRAEQGGEDLFLCEAILTEAEYVLSSGRLYHLPRERVGQLLSAIVNPCGIHMPAKDVCRRALDLYAASDLDFADALLATHLQAQGDGNVYSHDRHLDSAGLDRLEP
jgi:uncharacterized protein